MSTHAFDYQELLQLIELIKSSSHFTEFKLRSGNLEIELRRAPAGNAANGKAMDVPTPDVQIAPRPIVAMEPVAAAARQAAPSAPAEPARAVRPQGSVVVKSPMVGTFYRSSEPGAPAFVEPGQKVSPDSTLCIIEVMKLMNTINADCHGVVSEILVSDGEALEFGQELFVITAN